MDLCEELSRAAQAGDIDGLYAVIQKDPYILENIDQIPFVDAPLHEAVAKGNDDFAMEVMNLKPSFARKLNRDGYSPIHLALQNEKMVLRLLEADEDLVRVKGRKGYTPLHYVAEQGNVHLLAQFLVDCPECIEDVTIRNETALHVAEKNNKFEALRVLTQWLRRTYFYNSFLGRKLLNSKDKDGNTVLHVAASENLSEIVGLLLDCKVNMNEINSSGKTVLDILQELPNQEQAGTAMKILRDAEGLNAATVPRVQPLHELLGSKITFLERAFGEVIHDISNMSAERSSAVLVILVLILTSTYQATLSPPGGLLQTDKGKSALHLASFLLFFVPNTIAFIMTLILTLGLLAIVASGIASLLLVPLLLLYFCLLSSTCDISPTSTLLIFGFLPSLSLLTMLRVIGHAKGLKKYMAEKA